MARFHSSVRVPGDTNDNAETCLLQPTKQIRDNRDKYLPTETVTEEKRLKVIKDNVSFRYCIPHDRFVGETCSLGKVQDAQQ